MASKAAETIVAAVQGEKPPERRGFLVNEYTNHREFYILRGGVLRIRQSPKGPDVGAVYLVPGSSVTLVSNNVLEIRSRVPYVAEYILRATSESEADAWHDVVKAHIVHEQKKAEHLKALLESGCTLNKYNYSNSKRSRRYFWVENGGQDLCWGRAKGEDVQKVNLKESVGIVYGPMTTTFQRCANIEDPYWSCFSLLFMGRTLDLAVAGDLQVQVWFLGMQHLIFVHGLGSMPVMSEAQFIARKVQLKLKEAAHRQGLVMGRYLINQFKALASGSGRAGLGSGAVVSGGKANWKGGESNGTAAAVVSAMQNGVAKAKKEKKKDPLDDPEVKKLQARVLELQAAVRQRLVQTEVASATIKTAAELDPGAPPQKKDEAVRELMSPYYAKALKTHCEKLEGEARSLGDANEQLAPQVKTAKNVEKSLQKVQVKLDETELQRAALAKVLAGLQANTEASKGARASSSSAEAVAKTKSQDLQQKIQELERRLNGAGDEAGAAQEKALDKKVAAAEQERLELAQKLESVQKAMAKCKDKDAKVQEKLKESQAIKQKLQGAVRPLAAAVKKLKQEKETLKSELSKAKQNFSDEIAKVADATAKIGAKCADMQTKYRQAQEERKKLHNQVLDLKGNIRVFVRVRPINQMELPTEPSGEPTVTFPDDMKLGVYDGSSSRRKTYDFDQVFSPQSTQMKVFEEACPLATSVLDGYNVCIFAYGQTGSGKTHTMTGTAEDPGLNTRVLKELFRLRQERRGEYEINLSISITEIYNENIRDLLSPSKKKLDVKQNSDGTCGVPGLEERKVENVDEVLTAIGDAHKNRSTGTTDMNAQSSRSHSIVTVRSRSTLIGGSTFVGKVHLIDLAGSEDVGKSGVTGQSLAEAQNINKSLSALGDVIASLVSKSTHTPYRNSKLTMMLKDSLGGDSKTLMIVCCSPAQTNVRETVSSLNFASRARNVELGKAKRNVA